MQHALYTGQIIKRMKLFHFPNEPSTAPQAEAAVDELAIIAGGCLRTQALAYVCELWAWEPHMKPTRATHCYCPRATCLVS